MLGYYEFRTLVSGLSSPFSLLESAVPVLAFQPCGLKHSFEKQRVRQLIIKKADDKTKRLDLLSDLRKSPLLNADQLGWLDDEIKRVRRGIEGERDAAFYIDSYLKDSRNHAVIHDLRLEVDDEVAQIDHLFFNRMLHFFLVETKCFNGNLVINEHGEFTISYPNGKAFGIPSPIQQSKRHERILAKVLERLEITGRLGVKPTFHHLVLLHPKAIIKRPGSSIFDTSRVLKADALPTWHQNWINKDTGIVDTFTGVLTIRSSDTIKEWAEKLVRQHRPGDVLNLPGFMAPRTSSPQVEQPAATYAARPAATKNPPLPTPVAGQTISPSAPDESIKRKLICATCGSKISFAEGKYCWNNEQRFGGFQYCRPHQVG